MFKPGQSGNPNGRPIASISYKHKIEQAFLDVMNSKVTVGKGKNQTVKTYYDAFLEKFMADALSGDYRARGMMADRLLAPGVLDSIDSYINKGRKADTDFARYRVYLLAHDIQQEYLSTKERRIYQMAGRRAGKTDGHVLKALDVLQARTGSKVLYIARTIGVGMDQLFNQFIHYCEELGIEITKENRSEGSITIENSSEFYIKGNASTAARENMRGGHYDLIIIDEAQSQDALSYLMQDVCEPMLIDTAGTLVLSGTGPRVRGTYWEEIWENRDKFRGKRMSWNLSQNPYILNYETVLESIKEEKGLTDTTPLFIREYLGKIAYDDDAMVFRFNDTNFYSEGDLVNWVNQQPIDDIRFTAGLDYGYADSDAFVIIAYSKSSKEKYVVYEYKKNRTGVTELATAIKDGMELVKALPAFQRVTNMPEENFNGQGLSFKEQSINKKFYIYCDTNEQKISQELFTQFKLPTTNAYKFDKGFAIEMLQEDIKDGNIKVPSKESAFYQESLRTLWKRNDKDELTREIDDEYHPDMMDSILYSLRHLWKSLK